MTPTTTNVPVASLTCPGCDCRMCASDAAKAIAALDGVHHVRVDRLRGSFVVRHDPSLTDPSTISACVVDAGLHPA